MKLSTKYMSAIGVYEEWSKCSTPMSGVSDLKLPAVFQQYGTTPEEWLCLYESTGTFPDSVSDVERLRVLWKGKANRDWWAKEIRFWNRDACYVPEEFLVFLTPLCFIELFGRGPNTKLVRYVYDNTYSDWEFMLDSWIDSKMPFGLAAFEREDRESSFSLLWHVVRRKWNIFTWRLTQGNFPPSTDEKNVKLHGETIGT